MRGRVQGVGFRWWTRHTAGELGLGGTVRNARDGTVEVEAVGPASSLAELRKALLEGPPGAHVQAVDETEPGRDDLPARFEILR